MADYSMLDDKAFDRKLAVIVDNASAAELLAIPGVYEACREHYNDQVLNCWEAENPLLAFPPRIFDCLSPGDPDGLAERYTVFPQHQEFTDNNRHYLGCSKGGLAVSMWGELSLTLEDVVENLGREISLDDLDPETRDHVINRLTAGA